MALLPDRSPAAPVSRDDIARILAIRQLMESGQLDPQTAAMIQEPSTGIGAGTTGPAAGAIAGQGTQSLGSMLGMGENGPFSGNSFNSGAPSLTPEGTTAPSFGSSFGGGRSSFEGGGAMTTQNAGLTLTDTADPAQASPTFTEPDVTTASPFGREGDTTSQASQDKQAADRAAITDAVLGRSQVTPEDNSDVLPEGMGGKGDRGYVPGGYVPDFNDTFSQAGRATPTFGGVILSNTTPIPGVPSFPNYTPDVPVAPTLPALPNSQQLPTIVVTPSDVPPGGRRGAPGTPGDTGGVNSGVNSPGGGGFGGGIDMAATGGYEGSASVGNTTGAAGFTSPGGGSGFGNVGGSQGSYGSYAGSEMTSQGADPGGAVGGFGSGESGAGAGQGSGSDPGGSPGGVG